MDSAAPIEDRDGQESRRSSQTGVDKTKFNRDGQGNKVLRDSKRWDDLSVFFTIALALIFGGVLRTYDKKRVLTEKEQRIFYAVTEGLIIFLGLNNNKALKSLMTSFTDWSLRGGLWCEKNKNAFRKVSDFTGVMWLVVLPGATWFLRLVAISWLVFVLAAQALTAFVTYGFSTQDGTDYNGTYVTPGTVNVSDLACFNPAYYPGIGCGVNDDVGAAQAIAHAYGDVDQDLHCRELDHFSNIFTSKFDEECFSLRDTHEIVYRFDEYNPDDVHKVYPRFTNRTITASVSGCSNYTRTAIEALRDGESRYTFQNSTFTGSLVIPDYLVTNNGTTYIYRDSNPPQSAVEYACGPRCIRMWAYGPLSPNTEPQFYECAVSISEVKNATAAEHNISDDVARLVAASIGISGHSYKSNNNWTQFQLYPYGSTWNALSHYSSHPESPPGYLRPGDIMATNSLMALSVMAKTNRRIQMDDGLVPVLGSRLTVDWSYLIGVLCAIMGGHLLIWGLCWWLEKCIGRQKMKRREGSGGVGQNEKRGSPSVGQQEGSGIEHTSTKRGIFIHETPSQGPGEGY